MQKLNVSPEECLMVGNDVSEDMIAETIGMKVFLITGKAGCGKDEVAKLIKSKLDKLFNDLPMILVLLFVIMLYHFLLSLL